MDAEIDSLAIIPPPSKTKFTPIISLRDSKVRGFMDTCIFVGALIRPPSCPLRFLGVLGPSLLFFP